MHIHFEVKFILGVLLGSLSFVPGALAQSQAQTSAQASSQSAAPAKTQGQSDADATSSASPQARPQNASSNQPQMESQEAPPPESLGEAARRARAQKAAAASPAPKIYTDDKVARLSGRGVSVVGDGNTSGDASDSEASDAEPHASGAPKENAPSGNSDEKMWGEKARAIHDQMAQIDDRISKIQDEIQKYGAVSIDPSSGFRQNIIYVEDRNAQIKQLEEQKGKLQSQLDSLEEEGRKAGADSGWFR